MVSVKKVKILAVSVTIFITLVVMSLFGIYEYSLHRKFEFINCSNSNVEITLRMNGNLILRESIKKFGKNSKLAKITNHGNFEVEFSIDGKKGSFYYGYDSPGPSGFLSELSYHIIVTPDKKIFMADTHK